VHVILVYTVCFDLLHRINYRIFTGYCFFKY